MSLLYLSNKELQRNIPPAESMIADALAADCYSTPRGNHDKTRDLHIVGTIERMLIFGYMGLGWIRDVIN